MKTFRKSLLLSSFLFVSALTSVNTANAAYVCGLNSSGDNFVSLRTCPGKKCNEMVRIGPGADVEILDVSGRWYKIRMSSGAVGWAYGKYICD